MEREVFTAISGVSLNNKAEFLLVVNDVKIVLVGIHMDIMTIMRIKTKYGNFLILLPLNPN